MSKEDHEGFQLLSNFVDSFAPVERMTRGKKPVLDEDGSPVLAPRYIDTAQLLACSSDQEVQEFLGILFNAR